MKALKEDKIASLCVYNIIRERVLFLEHIQVSKCDICDLYTNSINTE